MPVLIDLNIDQVRAILDIAKQSAMRGAKSPRPQFAELYRKDLAAYDHAAATLKEHTGK